MDISTEDFRGFAILNVGFVRSHVFRCEAKVNKGNMLIDFTLIFFEADHDVLRLEIVIYSPCRVHHFETIQQLFAHGQNLLNLLQAVTGLLDIFLQVYSVSLHNVISNLFLFVHFLVIL